MSLDSILIMVASIEELPMAWKSLTCLLLGFDFLINIKKISFVVLSNIRVSRFENNFKGYDFNICNKKKTIVEQCQFLMRKPLVTVRELTQVINHLASAATALLPAIDSNNLCSISKYWNFQYREITVLNKN